MKEYMALGQRQKLIKFLMHLDDKYDAIRGQLLLMDSLPDLNKAYSMVVRVEKQKQLTSHINAGNEIAACAEITNITASGLLAKETSKGRSDNNKKTRSSRYCDHCHKTGHTQDQCFLLIGYPSWYEGPKDGLKNKKQPQKMAANVSTILPYQTPESPLDDSPTGGSKP